MSTRQTLWLTFKALFRYYRLKRTSPQCPRKLAEWIEGHRPDADCPIAQCKTEAFRKFSGRCTCGRFQAS